MCHVYGLFWFCFAPVPVVLFGHVPFLVNIIDYSSFSLIMIPDYPVYISSCFHCVPWSDLLFTCVCALLMLDYSPVLSSLRTVTFFRACLMLPARHTVTM